MSAPLLKELKGRIDEIPNAQEMDLDDLVAVLRQNPRYSKTSPAVLKTNIAKLGLSKDSKPDSQLPRPEDDSGLLKKRPQMADPAIKDPKKIKFDNFPVVYFGDLGGYASLKQQLADFIRINIRNRHLFHCLGVQRCPRHILINGPAGSGKSTLAAAVCNEAGLNFVRLTLYDPRIYSTLNDGKMSAFFKSVAAQAPAALIIDDLDSFFTGETGSKESERKVLQTLFDFFDDVADSDIHVIGTVTKMERISQGLLRSNRFEVRMDLKIPDEPEREQILRRLITGKKTREVDLREISFCTAGFVTADLERLVVKAAEVAIRENLPEQAPPSQNGAAKEPAKELAKEPAKESAKEPAKESKLQPCVSAQAFLGVHITQTHFLKASKLVTPIIKNEGFTLVPGTRWEDIGALQDLKAALDRLIIKPIMNPETCDKFGIKRQAGVLLYGPPGCGKTLLAKAVANACRANFIYVKGPELLSKYVGESEKAVRGLFERAKLTAPCLVFFDEIDGLCPKRSSDGNQAIERVVNQLLTEMNGIDDMNQIYLIAATNRPDIIDRAVLRPERLGVHLYVPLPNHEDRLDILRTLLKKKPVSSAVDVHRLAVDFDFHNFSGADLNAFVEAAARAAAWSPGAKQLIEEEDFRTGFAESKPSVSAEEVRYYDRLRTEFR